MASTVAVGFSRSTSTQTISASWVRAPTRMTRAEHTPAVTGDAPLISHPVLGPRLQAAVRVVVG